MSRKGGYKTVITWRKCQGTRNRAAVAGTHIHRLPPSPDTPRRRKRRTAMLSGGADVWRAAAKRGTRPHGEPVTRKYAITQPDGAPLRYSKDRVARNLYDCMLIKKIKCKRSFSSCFYEKPTRTRGDRCSEVWQTQKWLMQAGSGGAVGA